jgi:hypothetical protein
LKTSQFSVVVSVANRKQAKPAELTKHIQRDESTRSRNIDWMCANGLSLLKTLSEQKSQQAREASTACRDEPTRTTACV